MSNRVSLFIDYQNAYQSAREVFGCPEDDMTCGQFWPWELGEHICAQYNVSRDDQDHLDLAEVRVYRGQPIRHYDRFGYDSFQRQRAAWEKTGVQLFSTDLQYDKRRRLVGEKGIDVKLAIDFVVGGIEGRYDIGVLFSFDRDLLPALEYVRDHLSHSCRADVAGWGRPQDGRYLHPSGPRPVRHLISSSEFTPLSDSTDYRLKSSKFRKKNQQKRQR